MELAGGIITNNAGQILLLHRNTPTRVQWEIPGGKIETGEDPALAAAREIAEELGVRVAITQQLGRREFIEDGFLMGYTWFEVHIIEGVPKVTETATHDQLRFFSLTDLGAMSDLSPNTKNFLEAVLHSEVVLNTRD